MLLREVWQPRATVTNVSREIELSIRADINPAADGDVSASLICSTMQTPPGDDPIFDHRIQHARRYIRRNSGELDTNSTRQKRLTLSGLESVVKSLGFFQNGALTRVRPRQQDSRGRLQARPEALL